MIVSVVLKEALGTAAEGEVLHLEEDKAQKLVDAGLAEYAGEDDLGEGEGETAEEDTPAVVEASASRLTRKAEKAVEEAVKGVAQKLATRKPEVPANLYATATADPTFGYKSFGHYANDVKNKEIGDMSARKRLNAIRLKTQSGMNESTANQGEEIVPQYWADQIFSKVWNQDDALGRCFKYPMKSNIEQVPVVQASETGSTGVVAYFDTERQAITDSLLPTDNVTLQLDRLDVLVHTSNELLEDNPYGLDAFLRMHAPVKMRYQINDALFNTAGTHQAHLIGHAASLVIARASSADIGFGDLAAMYGHLWPDSRQNAVWYVNTVAYQKFLTLAFPNASGTYPATIFGGFGQDVTQAPRPTFMGLPVVQLLNLPALGTKGDVVLADMSQVACGSRDIRGDVSPHFLFDKNMSSFRFVFRFSTGLLWNSYYTLPNGVTKLSPVVVLGTTANTSMSMGDVFESYKGPPVANNPEWLRS